MTRSLLRFPAWPTLLILFPFCAATALAGEVVNRLDAYQKCLYTACEANKREKGLSDAAAGALAFRECKYERERFLSMFPLEKRDALGKRLKDTQEAYILKRQQIREYAKTPEQKAALRLIEEQTAAIRQRRGR